MIGSHLQRVSSGNPPSTADSSPPAAGKGQIARSISGPRAADRTKPTRARNGAESDKRLKALVVSGAIFAALLGFAQPARAEAPREQPGQFNDEVYSTLVNFTQTTAVAEPAPVAAESRGVPDDAYHSALRGSGNSVAAGNGDVPDDAYHSALRGGAHSGMAAEPTTLADSYSTLHDFGRSSDAKAPNLLLAQAADPATEGKAAESTMDDKLGPVPDGDVPAGQPASAPAEKIPNSTCLSCHGNEGFAVQGPGGQMRSLFVDKEKFGPSVHGGRQCVDCHTNVTGIPHAPFQVRVSCVNCHASSLEAAQKAGDEEQTATLSFVLERINKFMNSIHARPSRLDQSQTNATCYNCHDAHYVYRPGTTRWEEWRLNLPNTCGKCHTKELAAYATSVHGREVLQMHNPAAAICADCHTSHDIENPALSSTKLAITQNCGSCHQEQLKTYMATYHGQVNKLGFAYTAKCFDCHGNHTIQRVDDPRSSVFPANRVATCSKCHVDATAGFATFQPHGDVDDFTHYPILWLASKAMTLLLVSVFAFFWTHSGLWFYRSYKEYRARVARGDLYSVSAPHEGETYVQRFGLMWRIAHLMFLLSTMTLVLTGTAVLFSETAWAHFVASLFGSPRVMSAVHHTAAALFLTIFCVHLFYMSGHLGRMGRKFQWFGPDSLVPRWQDVWDIVAMFDWFLGRGPRPIFDRWTYWEKFDYWAVFWGVAVIGGSGALLWSKVVVAKFLPGWVFNVAIIFHGEEALLAAVFLFTVHFFNNHFRPDKFPLDTVMFTGAVSLEEFKREHTVEYERLVKSGELERHRVPAPSPAMAFGSRILGFTLITIGLILLLLVAIGFAGHAVGS